MFCLRAIVPVLSLGSALAYTILPITTIAGEPINWTLTKVNKPDKFELLFEDKKSGRTVAFLTFNAITKQTKGGTLMDGLKNSGTGYVDQTQGRGHFHGFDVFEKEGDIWRDEWSGECYMVSGPDSKPVQHCAGGWSVIPGSGTGRFAGLSGGGTFVAHALPSGEFEVEATGNAEK